MPHHLLSCPADSIVLPNATLRDREDEGLLIVNPPRPARKRSRLSPRERANGVRLVAAAGNAMLTAEFPRRFAEDSL